MSFCFPIVNSTCRHKTGFFGILDFDSPQFCSRLTKQDVHPLLIYVTSAQSTSILLQKLANCSGIVVRHLFEKERSKGYLDFNFKYMYSSWRLGQWVFKLEWFCPFEQNIIHHVSNTHGYSKVCAWNVPIKYGTKHDHSCKFLISLFNICKNFVF